MYRFFVLAILFLFNVSSFAAVTLSVQVTPTGSEDAEQAMNCELTLYRGRQNPMASLDLIESNLVASITRIDGYRVKDNKNVHVKDSKFGEIFLDFDHFVKGLKELAATPLKGHRDGGPIGPRITYRGEVDGKKFTLRDTSELGEVYNPHEDEKMLREIVLRNCYGKL